MEKTYQTAPLKSLQTTRIDAQQQTEMAHIPEIGAQIQNQVQNEIALTIASTAPNVARDRFGIVFALFALYVIWGSTYLAMFIALRSFPPFLMASIRFILAGGMLYIFLRVRGEKAPTRAQWLRAGVIGTLLLAGGNGGVVFAEQWVASGLTAVAIAAVPLWTAFFAGLLGRWPTRIEWAGLTFGFGGVLLLNLANGFWANPLGAIALLLSPICWSLGSALSHRLALPKGLMSSAAQMLVASLVLLLMGLVTGERLHGWPSTEALLAVAFLIVFGSLVAFTAYGYLLRRVRPALATSYAYVNPVVAVALGVALAGEHITTTGIVAMLVILAGVGLISLGQGHKAKA